MRFFQNDKEYRKIKTYLDILKGEMWKNFRNIDNIGICYCGYKDSNTPPSLDEFTPLGDDRVWGGEAHCHAWFHFTIGKTGANDWLTVETEHDGWNVHNPQFILYINGVLAQGLDTNHREHYLGESDGCDIYIYAYIGSQPTHAKLIVGLKELDGDVSDLYYDISYPFGLLESLDKEGHELSQILTHLYNAVSMLEMNDVGSDSFHDSVKGAKAYLADTLYNNDVCPPLIASVSLMGSTISTVPGDGHFNRRERRYSVPSVRQRSL